MLSNLLTKQLLKLFGFPFHVAPGEAEAECALLQREGLVDAVLSEDVDTLMFGCGLTLRNWSSEGTRGNKSPTHVSVYDAVKTKQGKSKLDREGMVLIALMSGGDYITEGIPGCGIKVASEAARAGFGRSLCRLSRSDAAGLETWRKNLARELQSNESKFFRTKHKTLKIPEEFPNREVLSYYTHPVVSSASKIESLKDSISWDGEVDVPGLRLYVAEAFDWTSKIGAIKFIRGLAPALLVHKLRLRGDRRDSGYGDLILTAMNEMELVRAIAGKRTHISSDGIPELRVIYHPMDIVGIDLDEEPDDSEDYGRDGLAPVLDDDQIEAYQSDAETRPGPSSPKKRGPSIYDPTQPDKAWIPQTIAKVGIPLKVEDYEESLRNPRKLLTAKALAKKAEKKGVTPKGAMDKFVSVSKPGKQRPGTAASNPTRVSSQELSPSTVTSMLKNILEKTEFLANRDESALPGDWNWPARDSTGSNIQSRTTPTIKPKPSSSRAKNRTALKEQPTKSANPWTLSQSRPSSSQPSTTITKPITQPSKQTQIQIFDLSSSSPPQPISTPRKHRHSPSPSRAHYPPTPPPNDHNTPSPRKKHSPEPASNTRPTEGLPLSPTLPPANRRLAFTSQPQPQHQPQRERSESPDDEFPTLSQMLAPPPSSSSNHKPTPEKQAEREETPETDLPSLQALLSPPTTSQPGSNSSQVISLDSSPPAAPRRREMKMKQSTLDGLPKTKVEGTQGKGKKYIMLRDSLPGGWKVVDDLEDGGGGDKGNVKAKGRGKKWRMSEVQVLDLTGTGD